MKDSPKFLKYSILILNYNGEEFLTRCIESTLEAMKHSSHAGELIVVDNASTDSSLDILNSFRQRIRVISMKENLVLCAYNHAVKEAYGEILILLNNDEYIANDFLDAVIKPFENNPEMFLVIPKTVDEGTGKYQAGLLDVEFKRGHFWLIQDFSIAESSSASPRSLGCLGAYRKTAFIQLGGFEPLYLPFYWEDADLSYRAAKCGWKILFEPQAVTEHLGQGTISKFIPARVRQVNRRNKLLFFYLNATDPILWFQHFCFFPLFLLQSLLKQRTLDYLLGWFWIIARLPHIFKVRHHRGLEFQLEDSRMLRKQ
mgnify:CR=1 FL=1